MTASLKPETQGVITLSELQARPEYIACTPKMQLWLSSLIQSDCDFILATETAFACKNRRQAQTFSYAIRNWKRIRLCLNIYRGISDREAHLQEERNERVKLLRKVRRNLKHSEPGSVAASRLLAQEERLVFESKSKVEEDEPPVAQNEAPPPIAAHRFHVGDICIQNGQKYHVTSVDPDGKPLTADEVE